MRYPQFQGTATALVTPFRPNGAIDYDALERLIDFQIANGVDYLVSLGTTGEAITLSSADCQAILNFTVKTVADRVPVVAGYFGSNSTSTLLDRLKTVDLTGVAAVLSSSPAYIKPTQEGIFQHYMAAVEASPLPVILYNVPGRTASNVAPETVIRLANVSDKFVGIKEASGNLIQAQYILKHRPTEDFLVISGDDQITLGMLACGGDGVISVIANAFPAEWSGMVTAMMEEDYATARHYNDMLHDIHSLLYVEGNPVGIKAAMSILGLIDNTLRLPLVPMSAKNFEQLKRQIEQALIFHDAEPV
jgi:4-hydroxy-tetrahydrodipicolinate synthase